MTSLVLGFAQALGLYLVTTNLPAIQGALQATSSELDWLTTAYFGSVLSSTALLAKFRLQYGLQRFASLGLTLFLVIAALHLATASLASAIAVRAGLGFAAAPLSALAVLYMVEAFPQRLAVVGLVLGFAALQIALPVARVLGPGLLDLGLWHRLFLFDVALALMSWAAIHAVQLAPQPLSESFGKGDLIVFPLYAAGLFLLTVVVSQGRSHWWTDAPWLGVCLVGSVVCTALYLMIDLRRDRPLLDLRWLATPYMLRFVFTVTLFRVLLSEQNIGIVGLMNAAGLGNEQMRVMFSFAAVATLAGFGFAALVAYKKGLYVLAILAACLASLCAFSDADATRLTRPDQLLLTQTTFAFANAVFFASSCLFGFGPVVRDGNRQIVSLLAAFSFAHYMGSLIGTAWITTSVADAQRWHFAELAQHISIGDPIAANRLLQSGAALAASLPDAGQRSVQALATLTQQFASEATVLAYNDVFRMIGWLGAWMAAWMVFLAWRARVRAALAAPVATSAAPIAS